jgi:hypothetical protein
VRRVQGQTVRFCVLIKLRPKKKVFPVRFVWAFSQKGLRKKKKKKKKGKSAPKKTARPKIFGEALVTKCPYEAVGDYFLAGA